MSCSILLEVTYYVIQLCYISLSYSVPQTIPVSVIPTLDGDNVLFQVFINVSL